ncbi:hypothetical protein NQZ79_g2162 [Umbelopsis isabellina]|nr:hypothetical protein NQZ79_g2162 [Umbelopsis isabellina]
MGLKRTGIIQVMILVIIWIVFMTRWLVKNYSSGNFSFDKHCYSANGCPLKSFLSPVQEPIQELESSVQELETFQEIQALQEIVSVPEIETMETGRKFPYTILTAASGNHLYFPRIVVYNIGMNRTHLPILNQLQANGIIDENVIFDFTKYPDFWDVSINAGEYGWKTGIIEEARQKYGGVLLWLDSGDAPSKDFLRSIVHFIKLNGFWSPRSSATMDVWTHPGLFKYFGAKKKDYDEYINCNGAIIGFDTTNATVVDNIMVPWYKCGLDKNCIAPEGSDRSNHRQDQAALTFLAYRSGHQCYGPPIIWGVDTHKDIDCKVSLQKVRNRKKLFSPSSLDLPKWMRTDTEELALHPEWRYATDEDYKAAVARP